MAEYKSWQQVLNTTASQQDGAAFLSGVDSKAPPRSVLAFAGAS
jgi:isoamylase